MKTEDTKHTPAPWTYTEGSSPHYQGQVYREDTGNPVAVTYHDEDGANARLIAAAPDMLAALQTLLPYLEERSQPGERWAAVCAREAIARATA